jgi:hypothetical protein
MSWTTRKHTVAESVARIKMPYLADADADVDAADQTHLKQVRLVVDRRPTTLAECVHVTDAPNDIVAPLVERGVRLTPWLFRGRRMFVVIDHTHSIIHYEPVSDLGDRDAQVRSLQVMLDALDPPQLLRLK